VEQRANGDLAGASAFEGEDQAASVTASRRSPSEQGCRGRAGRELRGILLLVSYANLDLMRSIYADWGRGNFRSADWAHPEVEFVIGDGPSPRRLEWADGIAESIRDWPEVWDDWHIEADEYLELDSERPLRHLRRGIPRSGTSQPERGKPWTQSPTSRSQITTARS
jgi:hypothetical protein